MRDRQANRTGDECELGNRQIESKCFLPTCDRRYHRDDLSDALSGPPPTWDSLNYAAPDFYGLRSVHADWCPNIEAALLAGQKIRFEASRCVV
jgi:hypothetical protein